MITRLIFLVRLAAAWFFPILFAGLFIAEGLRIEVPAFLFLVLVAWTLIKVNDGITHIRRVRLIAGRVDVDTLANRHRRQVEVPFDADEAFDLLDKAVRELPGIEEVESTRDSLQVRAKLMPIDPYSARRHTDTTRRRRPMRNQIFAIVTPGSEVSSITFFCEPEAGAWSDWLRVDQGTNLENAEALTRALTRRIAERRRGEKADVRETATEKELAVARLNLLHAQVEPHFLYNTLASAQHLARTNPPLADEMLGNLITYLRRSLPRTDDAPSTLGDELERVRAYLDIMRLRMGSRLATQVDVPERLLPVPFPTMMLQTLAENAIKHGLEPRTSGGTVWILANEQGGKLSVTVADDGMGFGEQRDGTGIGLRNVRERLQLAYGDSAAFSIGANFPSGVAATIVVPTSKPEARS
jgi:hypothetical protein